MKKITIVLGTAREGNFSRKVAEVALDHLKEKEVEITFVDVKDFLFSRTSRLSDGVDVVQPWADIVKGSDVITFICPEYNHSYPGELKILIDSLYAEYEGKTAAIVSTSSGVFGGVRAAEKLEMLLRKVNFSKVLHVASIGNVQGDFDKERVKKGIDKLLK